MRRASAVVVLAALLLVVAVLVLRREPKDQEPLRRRRDAVAVEEEVRPESRAPAPKTAQAEAPAPATPIAASPRPAPTPPPVAIPAKPGVIRGTVRLGAAPPRPKRIQMDADPRCAGLHAQPPFNEKIVADVNLGVKWAFVFVMQGAPPSQVPAAPMTLSQELCRFEPRVLGIQVGQPLLIRNEDPLLHAVHASPFANPAFNLGQTQGAPALKKVFQHEEVMVSIRCDIHPWMQAWVGVLPHPYFAVTDAAGGYALPPLPAGHYTVGVWHEAYETVGRPVDLLPEESSTLDFLLDARK